MFKSLDGFKRRRFSLGTVNVTGYGCIERVVDEGRFARTGDTRYTGQQAYRQFQRYFFQVVARGTLDDELFVSIPFDSFFRNSDGKLTVQVFCRQGFFRLQNVGR